MQQRASTEQQHSSRRLRPGKFFPGLLLVIGLTTGGLGSGTVVHAAEDPAVARAREEVRRQYEADKAAREMEAARVKAAAQKKAIALLRQGVVALYNPTTTPINYSVRWFMWDGTYTAWTTSQLAVKHSNFYAKAGALKLQINFSSAGGGKKDYALESAQIPSEVKASAADAAPNAFRWVTKDSLDLFKGKPKDW